MIEEKQIRTNHNTDGRGNKLVTVFAFVPALKTNFQWYVPRPRHWLFTSILHRDKFLATYQLCTATLVMLNLLCTWTAKTRAIPSLHRDNFLAKVPEQWPAASSGNAYSLNRRAVMRNKQNIRKLVVCHKKLNMRFKILTLVLLIPLTIHGQSSLDSLEVRVYNAGQFYIKTYSISVGNCEYLFKDIPKGEYSNTIKLPFIWSYNRTEATVIVKYVFRHNKLITKSLQPIDHEGDTKYISGKFSIIVSTYIKYGDLWLNAHVKKE